MLVNLAALLLFPLAVFFYTLANLSPQLRSSLKMIHLVTVAKSVDVSAYGIDEILKPFMNDILKLEKVCVSVVVQTFIYVV